MRFYRGYPIALMQAPLSRFGDIASYTLVKELCQEKDIGLGVQTGIGTACSSLWRLSLMPVDTCKTMLQVHGNNGLNILHQKIKSQGIGSLYRGYFGTVASTTLGYYPWFFTYGYLNETIPESDHYITNLTRNATIGFCASVASDTTSNVARVLKTIRQTSENNDSYLRSAQKIIKKEGVVNLISRGLLTKILSNGLQSATFTVIWKYIEKVFKNSENIV